MRLLRSFPILCFTLVLLSIVGLCVAQGSVGLLLMAGALAAISWYVTEGPRGRSLPKWVSNVLVIAVSLNVIVDLMQDVDDMLGVLGRFALWLTLIKLYERRTPRDHAHLLALSLLLMLTGSMQSTDLLFGVILVAYAALGLYVLLLYQLHASHEQARTERAQSLPAEYRLLPAARPILGRHASLHFRTLTVSIALIGLLLSVLVFAAFPRGVGQGAVKLAPSASSGRQRTSYSGEINLISGGRITESRRAVMTLQLLDHHDRPFRVDQPLLLRGATLDRYDGQGRWTTFRRSRETLHLDADRPARLIDTELNVPGVVRQVFDPFHEGREMFSAYVPVAIRSPRDAAIDFDHASLTFARTPSSSRLHSYTVYGALAADDAALEVLSRRSSFHLRLTQERNPAIERLAREVLAAEGVPDIRPPRSDRAARWRWYADVAAAFTRYLHSPPFLYTTDLSDVIFETGSSDPVEAFLFDLKRGHCEYFASALALLCDSVQVPVRVVTGFVAYEYDDLSQQYTIVESNAHAWTEVLTGPNRWTAFDPTPPQVLRDIHRPEPTPASRLRWLYDRLDGAWSRTIVNFDDVMQQQIAQRTWEATLTQRVQALFTQVVDWLDRVNRAFYLRGTAGYITMAIVGASLVILGVLVLGLVRVMRRSVRIKHALRLNGLRGAEQQRLIRQLGFYLDMLELLERARLPKPRWQPPLAYAEALETQADESDRGRTESSPGALVRAITGIFYEARYGGRPLSPEQVAAARTQVSRLADMLGVRP